MQMRKSQTEPARPELVSIVKPDSPSNRLELVSIVLARKAGWRILYNGIFAMQMRNPPIYSNNSQLLLRSIRELKMVRVLVNICSLKDAWQLVKTPVN